MTNSAKLVSTLNRQLKIAGITYHELSKHLGLSESAVKQMFSSGNFSLKRLDQICESINMDLSDLVEASQESGTKIEELGEELELELTRNPKLLLVAYCLVNHWVVSEILNHYDFNEAEITRYLVKLDRMKLIELLPRNRIRLLVTNSFKWTKGGPIENYFKTQVQSKFLQGDFQVGGALQLIKNGDITKKGQRRIIERMENIGALFDEICQADRKRPLSERSGTTMLLAIRNWQFDAFAKFEKV